jgi:hypothetical protein
MLNHFLCDDELTTDKRTLHIKLGEGYTKQMNASCPTLNAYGIKVPANEK